MPKPKKNRPAKPASERDRAMIDISPELRDKLAVVAGMNRRTVRAEAMIAIDEHLRKESLK